MQDIRRVGGVVRSLDASASLVNKRNKNMKTQKNI